MDVILIVAVVVLLGAAAWLFMARDSALKAKSEALRDLAVAQEKLTQAERRGGEFEQIQATMLQATKAAMTDTATQLSSKLLDDHKRENAESKKDAEARVTKASEGFLKQVDELSKFVASLEGKLRDNNRVIDTVWRSLSSPGGAGQIAEIGLANMLQSFGLEAPRDYVLQFSMTDAETGRRLRPDAVVFLPNEWVVVIDCKASKFLLDIAATEGTAQEDDAWRGLVATMNNHLKALASKDYQSAVFAACKDSGRTGDAARMMSLMYLPSEVALEKLRRADAEFMARARAAGIIPTGPAGLHCALSLATAEIGLERRAENHQQIIDGTRALIETLGVVLGHAEKVGQRLKSAAESFADFGSSVNKRLLPRARKLGKLGVTTAKPLPTALPDYSINIHETAAIDVEAEEIAPAQPPRPRLISE